MENPIFEGVQPWPEQAGEPAPRHHNQPPLEERIVMEFDEKLRDDGLLQRIQEITESAGRIPEVINETVAGKIGDLVRIARDCHKEVESRREQLNRPLLTAQRTLKGRADAHLAPLAKAIDAARARLNTWLRDEEIRRREEQRKADEAAAAARAAAVTAIAKAVEAGQEPAPAPIIEAQRIEAPVARGDTGARVGARKVWRHEIQVPIKSLPKAILENQKVMDAVNQVIGQMVRSGTREIKGVKIWEDLEAAVR